MLSESELSKPPLYSTRAIRTFSVLFSAIAGGVLLAHNLKAVGRPAEARKALWGSIGYFVLALLLTSFLPERASSSSTGLVVGLAGGFGLTAYFEQLVPNKSEFPAKSIRKPLVICLLIFIPALVLMFYALLQTG
ncbi:hypothetical protein [Hymenobacter sp. GOD-10R]|uniref:hypothetical protein n=1 Tax=Hymenobacter sp. GOD-10R TaxID=3093922 RepID=UPI002D78DDEB|nr:hypothetical protein [Hymenobacter sp. GOD-10R]WRQ31864.1 hypothetical protein SD425_29410 [Hymenobacter sp. GOD-10R]